jgi:prepilin-type N-terminal cleavage/methylation domain-containing protein
VTSRAARRPERQLGVTLIELLVAMIILSIVTTMLVMGWVNMQRATAFTVQNNDARADARDALSRMTVELRAAQPQALQTATPTPSPTWAALTVAKPLETQFYSAYNVVVGAASAANDGTGTAALRLTRFILDSGTLQMQRDTNNDGGFTTADRTWVLARHVMNASVPSSYGAYTPVFLYGYRDGSGDYQTTDNSAGTLSLPSIIAVQIRVITDVSTKHTPKYIDLVTTVRPRNAAGS